MGGQQRIDGGDGGAQAGLVVAGAQVLAQAVDDGLPLRGADAAVEAAVGDDFDRVVGQQQIDQHAVIGFGVPDAQLAEQRDRPLPRMQPFPEIGQRQAGFDADADLAAVPGLTGADLRFQAGYRKLRQGAPDIAVVGPAMLEQTLEKAMFLLFLAPLWGEGGAIWRGKTPRRGTDWALGRERRRREQQMGGPSAASKAQVRQFSHASSAWRWVRTRAAAGQGAAATA